MKIALTTEHFYPETGGAEQSALELAKAITSSGHELAVFTKGDGRREEIDGIPVNRIFRDLAMGTVKRDVPFPRIVDKKEEARLKMEIEGEGFDILHSNNRDTAVFTARVGTELGIPTVAHIRDYWPLCPKRDFLRPEGICLKPRICGNCMARFYNAWHLVGFYFKMSSDTSYRWQEIRSKADFFIYNSGYTQNRIGLSPGEVVYNPIDLNPIESVLPESGKVMYIGNVTERKGIRFLVQAISGLDVTLHIVGDGYLLPKISGDNIVKHGKMNYRETLGHLASSEMLIVPSLWPEPFGRVAVEGMAAGVPVIVSPFGGLPEVVGEAGLILKDISEEEIQNIISWVHSDNTLRKRLIEKGKEQARMFQPYKVAQKTIKIYEQLLNSQ